MAEAILWANIAKRNHERIGPGGRRLVHRVPQTATYGDYDDPRSAAPRFRAVVDDKGNDLHPVITTAAADTDTDGPYARRQRLKWRFYGWYEKGLCPCALYLGGDLHENHIVSPLVLEAALSRQACQPGTYSVQKPCPHSIAEMEARKAKNVSDDAERMKGFKSESDRMIEASAKNSQEIVSGVAGAMAGALKDAVAAMAQGKDKK